ncbi:NAD(P)/FAD-dependent oxidoreductase [Mesoterricola sediminis]|uniref:Amine oxidase n=1 Tax=Mesoterricola sediminis TaxID=2927980 RepID=A0AA48KGM5_9BACT|nr:FAD-dependent oxidoreductase [Mesoterricola sediminis]BDU77558.1 amine oxidase [Mesoterricola sediminis]
MRIAVIGAGISGLGAARALTLGGAEVHVFEGAERIGGHTHTARLGDGTAVDTGFIVHNRENYPRFVALMEELGVPTCASDMSFAYAGPGFSWCSRGLNGLLAERRNALDPRFWAFWREVARFNAWGNALARDPAARETPLGEALDAAGFGADFRRAYLYPMAGAVWSTPPAAMEAFPLLALLRFFRNHGMLGFTTQHRWRTIPGGTSRYLEPLARPFSDRIRTGAAVREVRRTEAGAEVRVAGEGALGFDAVLLACHGDQALALLADADPLEREVLGAFRPNPSPTWLHTDASVLPRRRRGWASWNFKGEPGNPLLLTYHMNRLQPLGAAPDLFVTLHGEGRVDPSKVLARYDYAHPRFDLAALRAQGRWAEVSGRRRVHFAGAYWANGFHEDGLVSGLRAAEAILAGGPR